MRKYLRTLKPGPWLVLVLGAGIVFYLPGFMRGRVLLPADVLCSVLPWQGMQECAGRTPANPIISDQVFQFFAWHSLVKSQGWSALFWNPYAFAGSPMAGNGQSALFYPLTWLHFVLTPSWSYVILAVLRSAIAATFTYLLAARRLSPQAAALVAASYVFSFAFVFSIGFPLGDALTWMPALFWAVEARRSVALALATALQLLSGQPQISAAVFLFLGLFLLWRHRSLREIRRAAMAIAVGVVVASPQLFLLYRYLDQSAAASLRSEFQPLFYSAHTMLEFLTPAFFGTSSPEHRWASNVGGYFGLIAAMLALAWIVAKPREAIRNPFFWIFVISLGLVYGVPPFAWVLKLPYLNSMFPPKFWGTATFSGAFLAGAGLDAYRRREVSWRQLFGVGILFALIALAARWHFRDFISALNIASFENQVVVIVVLVISVSLLILRKRPELAVLVLIGESSYYLASYNTAAPSSLLYPRTPVVDYLARDPERFRIVGDGVLPANTAGIFRLEDVRGYDALTPRKYFEYMAAVDPTFPNLLARLTPSDGLTSGTLSYRDTVERPTRYWGPAFTDYLKRVFYWNEQLTQLSRPQLLDLLNVKYYLVARGAKPPVGTLDYKLVYSNEVDVYENPHRLPRAFVVPQWQIVPDEKAALEKIRTVDFDPRANAILCCALEDRPKESAAGARFHEAKIVRYEPNRVVVQASGPGVLILTDSYFPGWRAEGLQIYEADYLFRGVVLNDGPQTITFSFHPFSR